MRDRHVVVVGGGMGGLVASLVLARRGLRVTLLDAADGPGGKLRPVRVGDREIDAGPTVFTMRWVFEDLLQELGLPLDALPPLQPLSVLARHAWAADGSRLDLHASRDASVDAIARFSSPAEARRFAAFCDEAGRIYRTLEGPHIRSGRPGFARMVAELGPRGLATLSGLGPFATLAGTLSRRLHDPRLQQLFARYATYCGSSPWAAPATLVLVAHVEQQGVWAVQGGMMALAHALASLAQAAGVQTRWGTRCEQLECEGGRVRAVRLAGGERIAADAVVFNGDAAALPGLVDGTPRASTPAQRRKRSLSAVTWAALARAEGFPLARHNVFFDADYRSEFADVFEHRRLPRRGTAYLCAQDRLDEGRVAGEGAERVLLLVNAPADGDSRRFEDREVDECETRALDLMKRCGLTLDLRSAGLVRRTPEDFGRLFPATGGALYGAASDGWMAVFRRPAAATPIAGLYLAGGSAHPGPGVPMAAMSGRLAAATLMADLASTRRSLPVRISGGTSMPSATTAAMPSP